MADQFKKLKSGFDSVRPTGQSPRQPRAVYDPLKTPAGQEFLNSDRDLASAAKFYGDMARAAHKAGDHVRGNAIAGQMDDLLRPHVDRERAAATVYGRQQSAAKSGFAQHLAMPSKKRKR